jgi:Zn-dependent peptidase ImmA (M78 family)/transcriptional regulator with XRE-family HTH domain
VDIQPEGLSDRIAARLRQARSELGLTLAQASARMGFENYQVLMNIEKGERAVKAYELVKFCEVYMRHLEFFLTEGEPGPRPAVAWRERTNEKRARWFEGKFLTYCEDYARLETLANGQPTEFQLTCQTGINSYDAAVGLGEDLGRRLDLGSHPAHGLCAVLEERGVKIMADDLGDAGSAASTRGEFGAGVLVNRRSAPWRVNYDLAHELFHLLTWDQFLPSGPSGANGEKPMADRYADAFASAFLLPGATVVQEFRDRTRGKDFSYLDWVTMATDFGVSRQALLYRLINLRLVTKQSADKAMDSDAAKQADRDVRRAARCQPIEWPTPRFVAIAFKCLQRGRVSRARFAQLMGIRRGEVDLFLAERGYDASEDYEGEISTA